jgi:hypothetical protein
MDDYGNVSDEDIKSEGNKSELKKENKNNSKK